MSIHHPYDIVYNSETGESHIEVEAIGSALLGISMLNKGSAFPLEEREALGLEGLLPPHVSTVEQQLDRSYENFSRQKTDLERYIYLVSLQDRNETLFYRLLEEHIEEMMPIVYTPVVGEACQNYSHIYRRPRGLYLSYSQRDQLTEILNNWPPDEVEVIVVSDGERILGLGDLGIGGMGIPIGKLTLYSLCAGIHPNTTLPIILDVGTDNRELLEDPLYLGWRHERIRGRDYSDFIEAFVKAVQTRYPEVLLQWEDFAKDNAISLLEQYRKRLCTFNDDIQGTGAVTLSALLSALEVTGEKISGQNVIMYGAGSAAKGIVGQILTAMETEGLSESEARARVWLMDSRGVVHDGRTGLDPFKQSVAQSQDRVADWGDEVLKSLEKVVEKVGPKILIGTSAQAGSFSREAVVAMAQKVDRPIILPLSNPTSKSEGIPAEILEWTEGRALVATGSPFAPVEYQGETHHIGQCNNAYIFPGVGLGVVAVNSSHVTDEMFVAAARALAELSPALKSPRASLLPPLGKIRDVSRKVALAVAREAVNQGLAYKFTEVEIVEKIEQKMWEPGYLPLKIKSSS